MNCLLKYATLILLLTSVSTSVQSQINNDSLISELPKISTPEDKAVALNSIAKNLQENDPLSAIKYAKEALTISHDNELIKQEIKANLILGNAYYYLDLYDHAYPLLLEALKIAETQEDRTLIAPIYNSLAFVHMRMNEDEEALKYFERSIAINKETKDTVRLYKEFGNKAILLKNMGEIEEARSIFDKVIKYFHSINDEESVAIGYYEISILLVDQGRLDSGEVYLMKCLNSIEGKSNLYQLKISSLINLAGIYILRGDYDKALAYLSQIDNAVSLTSLELFNEYYGIIYREQGDYKKAFKYDSLKHHYKDKLNEESTVVKVNNLKLIYNVESKNAVIAKLEAEKEREKMWNYIMYTLLFFLFVFGALIIRNIKLKLSRSRLSKKQIELEISQAENEINFKKLLLHEMSLNIIRNQEFFDEIKSDIKKVANKGHERFTELLAKLQVVISINRNKQESIIYTNEVSTKFFSSLNRSHPSLNDEEKHMCLLIFTNLTTKDIAIITNVSFRTVQNRRYRLRKKLSLSTENDISEYLKSIQETV